MGKIEVYFKRLDYADDDTYYHEFIVWTPDKGLPRFIRGGPASGEHLGSDSGGGSGSSGFVASQKGANIPFGAVVVSTDIYDEGARDWAPPGTDPSQVIITGPDQQLQRYWDKMNAVGQAIDKENIGYAFVGPNSNSVVTTLLQAAKLPQPKGNGLDGPTPAPGADMSLLNQRYSAPFGYDELAGNAAERGLHDVGHDLGAVLSAFRQALKAEAAKRSVTTRDMGLYDGARAAGRPILGGFAPIAGGAGRSAGPGRKVTVPTGGVGLAAYRNPGTQSDTGRSVPAPVIGEAPSYRAVMAQAQSQVAAGRARREAERAALNMPARGAGLAGMSFAPPPRGGGAEGRLLQPAMQAVGGVPGLRGRGSVHGAVAAAEAGFAESGEAAGDEYAGAPAPAQTQVTPFDIEQALETYFFQQSRLPPAGGAGFNPLLTPVWAGLKIPG